MGQRLQIHDPRERRLVAAADAALSALRGLARVVRVGSPRPHGAVSRRILLLRLERIGDLLMSLGPIAAVRERAPDAEIHLAVGEWNADLARLVPGIDHVEILSAPWLAREGDRGATYGELARRAMRWRRERYGLAINFEGDVRSNLLLALSGATRRVGFGMAGGGPALTDVVPFDAHAHVADNGLRLVERAFDLAPGSLAVTPDVHVPGLETRATGAALRIPDGAREEARRLLGEAEGPAKAGRHDSGAGRHDSAGRFIGVHASGGREIKQWHPERFAAVMTRLWRAHATDAGHAIAGFVLTGSAADRAIVDRVRAALPDHVPVVDLAGAVNLVTLTAVLERLTLLITGDTGPMHLAAAVSTPVVAVFGPSDPRRYAPAGAVTSIVRIDLPCAPCNRIRRPPERCTGHVPDCLEGISIDAVVRAAQERLAHP